MTGTKTNLSYRLTHSLFRVESGEDEYENDDIEALLWHWIRSCDITQVVDEGVTSRWVVLQIRLQR